MCLRLYCVYYETFVDFGVNRLYRMSGNNGNQIKQRKDNKGMSSQHEPKNKSSNAVNSQIPIDSHINSPINSTTVILNQSRTILYGQGGSHLSYNRLNKYSEEHNIIMVLCIQVHQCKVVLS